MSIETTAIMGTTDVDNFSSLMGPNVTQVTPNETYIPYQQRPETYIVPVIFAFIFVVGVLGNGTLVVIFIKHRNMRNVPNTYIFSLALGDLLVIITCVPFISTVYTVESWPFGETVCRISEFAKDVSIGVSVFTLTALSADRFFAIVDPMRKLHASVGGKRATRLTIIIAVVIWILAILCSTPAAIFSYLRPHRVNENVSFIACYPFPTDFGPMYSRAMVITKFVVYYAVPLVIIAFFYVLMARHLFQSTVNMPGVVQGQVRQIRARKKVAKMVLAFVIIFAICFFPHHVFMLWFYNSSTAVQDYNAYWHTLRICGFVLGFLNSCINPIALYCVSGAFRKHFKRYLLCDKSVDRTRKSATSRRNLTMSSSRRVERNCLTKSSWESTRRNPEDFTVTTFMNGGAHPDPHRVLDLGSIPLKTLVQ